MFKDFLDSEKVKYTEGTFDSGERYFNIPQRLDSGATVNVIVVFSAAKVKIMILGIAEIADEGKQVACYKLFNDFNLRYSFFKMCLRPDSAVCVDSDFPLELTDGELQPRKLMEFVAAALFFADKVYPEVMKIRWA